MRADARHEVPKTKADAWAGRRTLNGWTPKAIAAACGVSLRTAQRWRRSFRDVQPVVVDGYIADFMFRYAAPPVRVSAWRKP